MFFSSSANMLYSQNLVSKADSFCYPHPLEMNTSTKTKSLARNFKLVGFSFFFLGLVFSILGGYETCQGVRTKSWPATAGVIKSSTIESQRKSSTKKTGGSRVVYDLKVDYTYKVGDFMHIGDNLGYGTESYSNRYDANQAQRSWLKGTKIKVFYNPEDPKVSVLKTGMGLSWMMAGFGMVFVILGLYIMRMGKNPAKAQKETFR